jgi:hypothetical protein
MAASLGTASRSPTQSVLGTTVGTTVVDEKVRGTFLLADHAAPILRYPKNEPLTLQKIKTIFINFS